MKIQRLFKQKRTWVIAGGLILVIAAGAVWAIGSQRQQVSFSNSTTRERTASSLTSKIFSDKTDRFTRVKAISDLAALKTDDTCHADWWNDWQQNVLPSVKDQADSCKKREESLTKITTAATAAKRHLDDEKRVIDQLAKLQIDSSAKDWPVKALNSAQTAQKAINSIRVVNSVTPVQEASKERLAAVVTAWNELNSANEKKDKSAYLTAETSLKQAYADIAAIADVSDAQLHKIIGELTEVVKDS